MSEVVVLGSLNMDIVVASPRFPKAGETIMGQDLAYFVGGKGANQAVAAARQGISTTLLGKVGPDHADQILTTLAKEHLDLSHIHVEPDYPTGTAIITQAHDDNTIIVVPGANSQCDVSYVNNQQGLLTATKVLLGQLEIPIESLKTAFRLTKAAQGLTILNPAPYRKEVLELLVDVDYLTPNETEFAELVAHFREPGDVETDLLFLSDLLTTQLIVTRGVLGVSLVVNQQVKTIPALEVIVKDTTGAGDTFSGILAAYLAQGADLLAAVKLAAIGASLSVKKLGAQAGMPTKELLDSARKS